MLIDVACRSGYIASGMEPALTHLQDNFRVKNDDELLSLASNVADMTPESRLVLVEELQRRVERVKDHPTTIRLVHGWYAVVANRANVTFPAICPKCFERKADAKVSVTSQEHTKDGLYSQNQSETLEFPHCRPCATRLSRRKRLISWPSYCVLIAWFVACLIFHFPRLVAYFGALFLSLPMLLLLREGTAVELGDFGPDWIECRFRSAKYAEGFATMNHALQLNRETIQEELEHAIKSIQGIASGAALDEAR